MATQLQFANRTDMGLQERFLHYVAREGRTFLRWTIGVCLVAIVLCMVTLWFVAIVPALILCAAYILLLLANAVERRSDPEAHQALERYETAVADDVIEDHAEDDQLAPDKAKIVLRESQTGVYILLGVLLVALLIAAILFNWKVVAIGAMVVFAYMLLIAAPLWLGWFNDDIEIEEHRMKHQDDPAQAKAGDSL